MDGQVDICAEIKDFAIASFGQLCLTMVSTQSLTKNIIAHGAFAAPSWQA